jgi:hypothetical protein
VCGRGQGWRRPAGVAWKEHGMFFLALTSRKRTQNKGAGDGYFSHDDSGDCSLQSIHVPIRLATWRQMSVVLALLPWCHACEILRCMESFL